MEVSNVPNIRVFDRITKEYQRLGYLKRLIKRVTSLSTSSLENLGNDLIETVTKKINVPLNEDRVNYIKLRLFDRIYKSLKEQTNDWLKNGGDPPMVPLEIQDLYLADPLMPSSVGKLNRDDSDTYPPLGVNLGLIRAGTYSANTRAYSFLQFIPEQEHKAFSEYIPNNNPFLINRKQALLLLYSLVENDGEVFIPLISQLAKFKSNSFNDREAGDLLPEIYWSIIQRYRKSMLALNLRERLEVLERSATIIASQSQKEKYTGGSAREHASRPRLEPYVDIGLLSKPLPTRYEYQVSNIGQSWVGGFTGKEDSISIDEFLNRRFFFTTANAWQIKADSLTDSDEIILKLRLAAKRISSSSGYAPIEELALLAGIESLVDDHKYFEIGTAREVLIAYQKANPYQVRFTVNRMNELAYVKFVEDAK